MNQLISAALESRWATLRSGLNLYTPDVVSGSPFIVSGVTPLEVEITTNGGNTISIGRNAFVETLRYLLLNHHDVSNRCGIGANKDIAQAGPLCICARRANGSNIMIISYLLPLLAHMNLVRTDGSRLNTVWLM